MQLIGASAERIILEKDILPAVGGGARRIGSRPVTACLGMRGQRFDQQLLIVGRAVNEWALPINALELTNEKTRRIYAASVASAARSDRGCPLAWLTKSWGSLHASYDPRRSALWRVVRAIALHRDPSSHDWASSLAWTNLYKVTSAAGGNPGGYLRRLQLDGCVKMLRYELTEYKPRLSLFITGLDWAAPFLEALHCNLEQVPGSDYVDAAGTFPDGLLGGAFIVAKHPRGRSETAWTQEVIAAIEARDMDALSS
jgi:hypothetical protein